jgi:hypothetical protein
MVIVLFPLGQCGATSEMLTILTGFLVEIGFLAPVELKRAIIF